MSEHTHNWMIGAAIEGADPTDRQYNGPYVRRCEICDIEEPASNEWILHWLLDIGHARSEVLEQQLAEARALLEEVGNNQEVGVADGDCDTICFYCGGDEDGWIEDGPPPYIRTYNHTPDCTWVKIRAFLQKIGG